MSPSNGPSGRPGVLAGDDETERFAVAAGAGLAAGLTAEAAGLRAFRRLVRSDVRALPAQAPGAGRAWIPLRAQEWFSVRPPGFAWDATTVPAILRGVPHQGLSFTSGHAM